MAKLPKEKWGDGPWQNEPDAETWVDPETDLPCLALRGPHGAWCGYVGVPPDHPANGISYYKSDFSIEEIETGLGGGTLAAQKAVNVIEVHGGLTFAGKRDNAFPASARCRGWHFFGFDCAHAGDYDPGTAALLGRKPGGPLSLGAPTGWGTVIEYRDLEYVKRECASLAKQLVAIR